MIALMPVAADKVKELLTGRGTPEIGLRVGVRGGGCSGNSYFMEFCEAQSPGDEIVESNGVKLYVDPISVRYLGGAEVDFVDTVTGGGFTIKNPNAVSTCGCGQSFTV